jgi:hypothetical protein
VALALNPKVMLSCALKSTMRRAVVLQWQCMERAGIKDSVLERIREVQQSIQSRKMRTIQSSIGDAVETLCKQLASGEEVKLLEPKWWLGSE